MAAILKSMLKSVKWLIMRLRYVLFVVIDQVNLKKDIKFIKNDQWISR